MHCAQILLVCKMTRLHNDANMLAMGAGVVGENLAMDIVDNFPEYRVFRRGKTCREELQRFEEI